MSKRKNSERTGKRSTDDNTMDVFGNESNSNDDGSDGEAQEIVDVDFEFFDPKPIDFHAIKSLLNQLFSADAELFALSELADLILSQPLLGSTVKVDGPESDPYALLTAINLIEHRDKTPVHQIIQYLEDKCPPQHRQQLHTVLSDTTRTRDTALVISERLINMPMQIIPPMFRMLIEELEWAVEDREPYDFECYVFITKTYKEVAPSNDPTADDDDVPSAASPRHKKKKSAKIPPTPTLFYFHPEEEILERHSLLHYDFRLTRADHDAAAGAKSSFGEFGIVPARRVFVCSRAQVTAFVGELERACA